VYGSVENSERKRSEQSRFEADEEAAQAMLRSL
jgi:hypothetical protein